MGSEIRIFGFNLTVAEWNDLDAELRGELLSVADVGGAEDDVLDDGGGDVLW